MESTKDYIRIYLGLLEMDKVVIHKPRYSLVDGMILEITQKEISWVKKIQMDSGGKASKNTWFLDTKYAPKLCFQLITIT